MGSDAERIAELNAIVAAVRDRVRSGAGANGAGSGDPLDARIHLYPADLMPIVRARDAAQAKIAAIGGVNPRAGGVVNSVVQSVKKLIARSLQWFVRDQVVFNRESIAALEAVIEALTEQNQMLMSMAGQVSDRLAAVMPLVSQAEEQKQALAHMQMRLAHAEEARNVMLDEARELKDVRAHWSEWRIRWEQNLATNEVQFLRAVADLQSAFQHRVSVIEGNFREMVQAQHRDYLGALDRANVDIQKRLWGDLEKVRESYERMIHSELRLIRLRARGLSPEASTGSAAVPVAAPPLDYSRFAERFRGSDEEIRLNMEFYRPYFAGLESVLDIGCGRGEFLDLMRDLGVGARGIDLSAESVAQCVEKGLHAEVADLFQYLPTEVEGEFDGIMSSQVVEHLPPGQLPEMIRLCASKLRRGGVLVIETPNPECLAIFATYFYLDPTHTRPMPHQYVRFCMEEAGLTGIEVHTLSPAIDSMPELSELPGGFRERFFGGLDYAIIGRKI